MTTVAQRSFAGGEITPSLYARVDTVKYATGLRTCRNFMVMRHGGASNRPGTEFVGEVKDSTKAVRFIPFIFNDDQTYALEFGHLYMRVIRNGAHVSDLSLTITDITGADPAVVTYTGTDPSNGDEVAISGVVGAMATFVNGRNFKVANVNAGSNTFELQYMDGTNVDSTGFGSYTSGGTAARVYTITTPYVEDDLSELQYVQSADIITITHPHYAPRELARTGHAVWTLTEITFAPSISAPTNLASGAAGSTYNYVVTAIAEETFEESLASASAGSSSQTSTLTWTAVTGAAEYNVYKQLNGVYGFIGVAGSTSFTDATIDPDTTDTPPTARNPFALESAKTITAITKADPAVVTATAHGYATGDIVFISSVGGMTEVNDIFFEITVLTADTFSLQDLSGDDVDSTGYTTYTTGGSAQRAGNYPSTVTYIQQRLGFGNSRNNPERVWLGRSANFKNFTVSSPLQDDDAVTFTLAGRRVNEVRHMLDLDGLMVFTSGGEWAIEGDEAGIIRPGDINPKQKGYYGSSTLPPIIVGSTALYVQARGSIIRDLFHDAIEGQKSNDLTIFSNHLFDSYTLVDWTYSQIPHSIVWGVRNDGILIGLTYVREHQVWAWHRHDFDGTVENVVSIPESGEDVVYLVIKRTIDGAEKRYIERMASRHIDDIIDAVMMDSSLSYDGRNTDTTHTMTLSGGTDWLYTETLTLTSSASYFASTDVGNEIHLYIKDADGEITDTVRCEITGHTNTTVVSVKPNKTVPAALRSSATDDWAKAVDEISGLWHIEGKDVSVFADKFVVASPNNEANIVRTVSDGAVTLDKPYTVIHIGLPVTADLETLDIDTAQGETVANKKKVITAVTMFVEKSRGVWVGGRPPTDDDIDPLEGLTEAKVRSDEGYDDPVNLTTGVIDVNIQPEWNSNGRVFIRQVDPIPLSVLAIVPSGMVPFR